MTQESNKMQYRDVPVGVRFIYDNELFVKCENQLNQDDKVIGISWSIKKDVRYKEWAFGLEEEVTVMKENNLS